MSYYRGSGMSSRGRGGYSSRGSSYRGSSSSYRGGSSSYRGSGGYSDRGGFSTSTSSRGRYPGNSSSYSTGFDSRSRYTTGSSDRYSSSARGRDDGYRRSNYRPEGPYSSSRDHSRGSPDRKRMRTDQGSSSRRSDGGYGGGSGDFSSSARYENSSSYGNSDRRYSSERPRSPKDFRVRETSYRKPESSMPPPSSLPPRRGSFRGRISSRGARGRGSLRRSDVIGRRRINDTYHIRRRVISTKSHDYARRLKIQKMRSSLKKRASGSSPEPSEKEEEWEIELEDEDKEKEKKKKTEETATTEKEAAKPKTTPKKEPKAVKTESADEATDKEDNAASGEEAEDSEKKATTTKSGEKLPRSRYTGRSFIRLTCTHCSSKCVTFKEYAVHLHSTRHITAMRRLALKQKGQLARMRLSQRNAQRDIDEKTETPGLRTNFCPLCKLNYRQLKSKHQTSEAHRNMKKFLMPYCKTCRITFKSPMLYEGHMCSLEHIKVKIENHKRKAREGLKNGPIDEVEAADSGDEEVKELDLDNFMTLDSVGDVDEVDDDNDDDDTEKDGSDDKTKTPKVEINVGNEHVKKVEVYYCELCRMYLPRKEELEAALKKHCRTRSHLQKYVRYRDDKALRREAERIHRKNQEAKEAKEKDKAEKTDEESAANTSAVSVEKEPAANESLVENGSVVDEDETGEEKLWAEVDKDLGELLRDVEPNKSSDDEEDSRAISGRYDRFKYSDKKGVASDEKGDEVEKEDTTVTKSEDGNTEKGEVTEIKEVVLEVEVK